MKKWGSTINEMQRRDDELRHTVKTSEERVGKRERRKQAEGTARE